MNDNYFHQPMRRCPSCNHETPAHMKYCLNCGVLLEYNPAEVMQPAVNYSTTATTYPAQPSAERYMPTPTTKSLSSTFTEDESARNQYNQISTQYLCKTYKKRIVVNQVNVEIRRGEVVGLLGPNGAGKTTTFYMIVGLVKPNTGRIFLDSVDITTFPMYRRARLGIGYLAQEASIFRKLTVEENIMAILEILNIPRVERLKQLEELLDALEIQHIRKSKAYTLSGGERRRTEIARSLAIRPNFLLLDEPFAGIDPIAVQEIQQIILKLKYSNRIGILITDHNARETLRITDRSYILAEGTIRFQGNPEILANNPDVRKIYLGDSFSL